MEMDATQVDAAQVARLRTFINYCKFCPSVLNDPSLELFRQYLKSLGGQIPPLASKRNVRCERCDVPNPESTDTNKPKQNTEDGFDEEIVESDIGLEAKLVELHNDFPHKAGDPSIEITKEIHDTAQMSKEKALNAISEGNVQSIHSLTELETKLKAAAKLSRLAILYFTATWSGPCRSVAPACKSSAEQHPKTVFLQIDVDEVHIAVHRWNVSSVPSFLFVKDGKEIDKVVGADQSGLERKIALHSTEE